MYEDLNIRMQTLLVKPHVLAVLDGHVAEKEDQIKSDEPKEEHEASPEDKEI